MVETSSTLSHTWLSDIQSACPMLEKSTPPPIRIPPSHPFSSVPTAPYSRSLLYPKKRHKGNRLARLHYDANHEKTSLVALWTHWRQRYFGTVWLLQVWWEDEGTAILLHTSHVFMMAHTVFKLSSEILVRWSWIGKKGRLAFCVLSNFFI